MDVLIFSSGSLSPTAPKDTTGIYGIQNHVTGKWYVGQASVGKSSRGVRTRAQNYLLLRCKRQKQIYHSLKMYGLLNHSCYLLEECDGKGINRREQHWMKVKNSLEDGYNISGGSSKPKKKRRPMTKHKRKGRMCYATDDPPLETR